MPSSMKIGKIKAIEPTKKGYGQGSFVVIKALKMEGEKSEGFPTYEYKSRYCRYH